MKFRVMNQYKLEIFQKPILLVVRKREMIFAGKGRVKREGETEKDRMRKVSRRMRKREVNGETLFDQDQARLASDIRGSAGHGVK